MWRGVSQSDGKPSVYACADQAIAQGFYVGGWQALLILIMTQRSNLIFMVVIVYQRENSQWM